MEILKQKYLKCVSLQPALYIWEIGATNYYKAS